MHATSRPRPGTTVRLNDVTVRRGPNRIVEGLDLELGPGRIFWIIGPNGAGKSSLLRVIAGLDAPAAGTVARTGATGARPGYFHSEMGIPSAARVRDWARLVERLLRTAGGRDEPPGGARRLRPGGRAPGAGRTALWPAVSPGRPIGRLSTGERKRLLLDPLLRRGGGLVLDEPFEHLSPDARTLLHRMLTERARHDLVVVATNEATDRGGDDPGLHLDGGVATPLSERAYR